MTVLSEKLHILVKRSATSFFSSFSTLGWMPSGHGDLLICNLSVTSKTSSFTTAGTKELSEMLQSGQAAVAAVSARGLLP